MLRRLIAPVFAAALAFALAPVQAGTLPSPTYGTVTATVGMVLPDGTTITCGGTGPGCVALGPALAAETAMARAAEAANGTAVSTEATLARNAANLSNGILPAARLPASGVAAGSAVLPSLTVDSYGRITALSQSALSGDVVTASGSLAAVISANAVTNAKLAQMAPGTVKANTGAASATPSDVTPSALFDAAFGLTRGAVLYRGVSGWVVLPPGVSGQMLATSGSGADPSWVTPAGASGPQNANAVLAGPASGTAAAPTFRPLVPADEPAPADGCIRISVASATQLKASPYGCNTLWIGGVSIVVTTATVTPASPAASTLFYVYAVVSGGTETLSIITTSHITGSDGREYANSAGAPNTNYRLIGMVYTNASGQFSDTTLCRCVLNFFHRVGRRVTSSGSSSVGTASTTPINLTSPSSFLAWSDEAISAGLGGSATSNTVGQTAISFLTIDGAAVTPSVIYYPATAGYYAPATMPYQGDPLAEGVHTVSEQGESSNTGATATWVYPTHYLTTRG
ncbi:MAG: hypothetical protein ACRYGP_13895 [Janthinobacterium lividum]